MLPPSESRTRIIQALCWIFGKLSTLLSESRTLSDKTNTRLSRDEHSIPLQINDLTLFTRSPMVSQSQHTGSRYHYTATSHDFPSDPTAAQSTKNLCNSSRRELEGMARYHHVTMGDSESGTGPVSLNGQS